MSLTNAILNIIIVFRPFPFPLQGVWGIAVSSVVSQAMGMCLLLYFFMKASFGIRFEKGILKHLSLIGKIFSIGVPGGISNLSYSLSQVVSTSIVATLGALLFPPKSIWTTYFFM